MKKKKTAIVIILQVLLVSAGALITLIISAAGNTASDAGKSEMYSVAVGVLLIAVVVIEISSALKIHSSTIHTVFTSSSLLLSYLFSSDMQSLINPSDAVALAAVAEYVNFVAFHLIVLSHAYLINYLYKTGITKKEAAALSVYSAADCFLYFILSKFSLQYIAYLAYIPPLIFIIAKICLSMVKKQNCDTLFILISAILSAAIGIYGAVFVSCAGLCGRHIYSVETTYILLIVLLYILVYFIFITKTDREALAASEYKLKAEKMKTRILREQINPHFIFNSLLTVKEAYHRDMEGGDRAMNFFSRYLRANVEAMSLDLIAFGGELDIIENYIGLENMKREKPVNIIYDVEYDAFNLPVLSLQVFVENAVKYARTEEKEDGYISISSRKCPEGAMVEVCDNGVGFDVNEVKENSCGIKNARERFKILLNTDVQIESVTGEGTRVKIYIPEDACGGGENL
ncbi:MAG: histidine kinase [Clostridia bacterium]|nr:histidine kinase [Clostridia bacterium]